MIAMKMLGTYGLLVGVSAFFASPLVLAQSGTGAGPRSAPAQTGKSGSGTETDAGRGVAGKKSPFGSDQPTSGDFSPGSSGATKSQGSEQVNPVDKRPELGMQQPSGIGEKGSGQTQPTTERSGGPQPSASESMSNAASQHGQGKSEQAAKQTQEDQQQARHLDEVTKRGAGSEEHHQTNSPPHLGPQGGSTADSGKAGHGEQSRAESR